MPPKELELFYFLASHPNQVFTREQLLDHIWSYDYIGDTRTVDVHIKRLREKFKDHPAWKLTTVWESDISSIPQIIFCLSKENELCLNHLFASNLFYPMLFYVFWSLFC